MTVPLAGFRPMTSLKAMPYAKPYFLLIDFSSRFYQYYHFLFQQSHLSFWYICHIVIVEPSCFFCIKCFYDSHHLNDQTGLALIVSILVPQQTTMRPSSTHHSPASAWGGHPLSQFLPCWDASPPISMPTTIALQAETGNRVWDQSCLKAYPQ